MATPLMGYYAPSDGADAGTWGSSWNSDGSTFLDNNFAGITSLSLGSSNVLLTAAQARNQMIRCAGTLLANIVISPDAGVLWNGIRCVENVTSGSFTVTLTNAAGSVTIPQSRRCVVFLDTTNGPRIIGIAGTSGADAAPVGTVSPFYMNAAPTGWTISSALNDYALKIVSSAGGVTSGSVAYSTAFGITATDSTALTIAQMPLHGHPFRLTPNGSGGDANGGLVPDNSGSAATYPAFTGTPSNTNGEQIGGTGAGDGHTHGIDLRVQTAAFILATRN